MENNINFTSYQSRFPTQFWLSGLLILETITHQMIGAVYPQVFRDPAVSADSIPLFIGLTTIGLSYL